MAMKDSCTKRLPRTIFVLFLTFLWLGDAIRSGRNDIVSSALFLADAFSLKPSCSSSRSRSLRAELLIRSLLPRNLQLTKARSSYGSRSRSIFHAKDVIPYSDLMDLVSGAEYMDSETKSRLLKSLSDRFVDDSHDSKSTDHAEETGVDQEQNMDNMSRMDRSVPTMEGSWTNDGDRFRASGAWQRTPLFMKGAFLEDLAVDETNDEFPFPTWEEMIELACNGGGSDYDEEPEGGVDFYQESVEMVGDYKYDDDVGTRDHDFDGDYHEVFDDDDDDDDGEDFYMWDPEEDNDIDVAPSRLIQYSWPNRHGSDGSNGNESDYYHADVNTDWLDTFEITQFGPFSDPPSLEALLKTKDCVEEHTNVARTLLVNDVDRWCPKLSDWMDRRFNSNGSAGSVLPARWRRDDAQISLSHPAGGIGPHVDDYDVFLIQIFGERTWDILWHDDNDDDSGDQYAESYHENNCVGKISVRDETDSILPVSSMNGVRIMNVTRLQLLEKQRSGKVRTKLKRLHLRPGDCLYLPPRVLHCGTALQGSRGECMTLSVGCRAPSALELVDGLSDLMKKAAVTTTPKEGVAMPLMFPSDASLQSFHKRYTNSESKFGKMQDRYDRDTNGTSKESSHSHSSWLSPKVKNEMKDLVLDAVRTALEDDENVLDPLVGKFVTRSNRVEEADFGGNQDGSSLPCFSYPKPFRGLTDNEIGGWANAATLLADMFCPPTMNERSNSNICLRRAEGIAFAWSCVSDTEQPEQKYRLYAQGRPPFEVIETSVVTRDGGSERQRQLQVTAPDSTIGRLMDRIANGPPLSREFVVDNLNMSFEVEDTKAKHSIAWLLHELVEEGLLYGVCSDQLDS